MSHPNPLAEGLSSRIVFLLKQAGVPDAQHLACLTWAFGPEPLLIPPREWPSRWNVLHPTAFRAKASDKFVELMFVVGTYYLQEKQRAAMKRGGR